MRAIWPVLMLALLTGPGTGVAGEIYRRVDASGAVSYSDQPGADAETVELGVSDRPSVRAARVRSQAQIAEQLDVAERLASDRRARDAARLEAQRVRATLAEARAREASARSQDRASRALERERSRLFFPLLPGQSGNRRGIEPLPDPSEPVLAPRPRESRPLPP